MAKWARTESIGGSCKVYPEGHPGDFFSYVYGEPADALIAAHNKDIDELERRLAAVHAMNNELVEINQANVERRHKEEYPGPMVLTISGKEVNNHPATMLLRAKRSFDKKLRNVDEEM